MADVNFSPALKGRRAIYDGDFLVTNSWENSYSAMPRAPRQHATHNIDAAQHRTAPQNTVRVPYEHRTTQEPSTVPKIYRTPYAKYRATPLPAGTERPSFRSREVSFRFSNVYVYITSRKLQLKIGYKLQ